MNALIAGSTLANYVPLQAGSIGRLAYHKVVHGIPVKTSLVAILVAMGLVALPAQSDEMRARSSFP